MKFLASTLLLTALSSVAMAGSTTCKPKLNPPAGTIISQCNRPGIIALTFDDGPGPDMDKLIDTLDAAGAKATFFVTGTLYGCIHARADFIKKAVKSGHQIGSHTWTHPDLTKLTEEQVIAEMTKLEGAFATILDGKKPTYMRPPYLSVNDSVAATMKKLGYRIIQCDVDSQDWNNLTPEQSMERIKAAGVVGNGHIPLMHETVKTTPAGLAPLVIQWAKENNLEMVTVAECLGDKKPYVKNFAERADTC